MQLQHTIILLASIATVLTMIIARYVTRKIVLEPLHYISSQLRRSGSGRRISDLSEQNIIAVHEFAELQELYSALNEMALTDPLTQLPNRLQFERRLENMFESACANNETHALCY
ncbi:MAG: GGDEF domain-containing protein, partial [Thiogranum sp.]